MNYRLLGSTGLKVSDIGFGAWGIGGLTEGATSYGATNDAESKRALLAAYEHGVTFYDSSDVYGYGHSEELIGEVFRGKRHEIILATKVGFLKHRGPQVFTAEHMRKSVEGSLRRLRTDYIDLYQLHSPPLEIVENNGDILNTLQALHKEGKIRAYGMSVKSPEHGLIAVNKWGYKALQVNLNLTDLRADENGLLELCEREDVGVIARTPLCFGLLTGRYKEGTSFDKRDHRSTWSAEQIKTWVKATDLFMKALQNQHDQSPAQICLRFCLSYPAVATVIPGMLKVAEVDDNIVSSDLGALSEQEMQTVKNIYHENNFFI